MLGQDSVLFGDYTLRVLDDAEFDPLFRHSVLSSFRPHSTFTSSKPFLEEQAATGRLREQLGTLFRLNIGLYCR
jgi:hypothetical protein